MPKATVRNRRNVLPIRGRKEADKTMRKMMMVALFSVLSLSACAVEEPVQTAQDEAPAEQQPCNTADDHHARPTNARELEEEGEAVWLQCDDNSECESNVCDLEIHTCREYPF
ncbi:MAG TPA: hypothetical protein VMZ53_24830 [Kofleriaceae bacterium]|nr:hypothetical protein [Kofleriaceae bacterium]